MPSPSLPTQPAHEASFFAWLDARTEVARRIVAWTPERDLYDDYLGWARAEQLTTDGTACAEVFADLLGEAEIKGANQLVERKGDRGFEPCRAIRLIPAIQAAA